MKWVLAMKDNVWKMIYGWFFWAPIWVLICKWVGSMVIVMDRTFRVDRSDCWHVTNRYTKHAAARPECNVICMECNVMLCNVLIINGGCHLEAVKFVTLITKLWLQRIAMNCVRLKMRPSMVSRGTCGSISLLLWWPVIFGQNLIAFHGQWTRDL